jgi:predicted nucleic acid-binding Zn ribbon protein
MALTLHYKANIASVNFYRLDFPAGCVEAFQVMPPPRKTSARQRVLAQWRGMDLAPLEVALAVRARRAGDVLSRVTKDLRLDQRRAEVEVVKVWNSLLDPDIVAHAQPAGIRNGTLFVNVDSSVWLSEIVRYRRREVLDRLQHSFGRNVIQRISFRVG